MLLLGPLQYLFKLCYFDFCTKYTLLGQMTIIVSFAELVKFKYEKFIHYYDPLAISTNTIRIYPRYSRIF